MKMLLIILAAFFPQQKEWLEKAENAKPALYHTLCKPVRMVEAVQDTAAFQGWRYEASALTLEEIYARPLAPGQSFTFDFGGHKTGTLSFSLKTMRRCQDAPVRLRFFMGELPAELNTPLEPWGAWLSRAWMQEEVVNVTETDKTVTLPRRMAGRYLRVDVIGASKDFDCAIHDVIFDAVSSAGEEQVPRPANLSPALEQIYRVGVETLHECMQTVYEDGPKRDQRLWAGDLYLESLANRCTFRNFGLTRRCLYLFAALAAEDGTLISNIFEHPVPHPQDSSYMITYCLLWNSTLKEYLSDTHDYETARDLWPVAKRQIEDALSYLDEEDVFDIHKREVWIFFDWRDGLDVSSLIQCATIFALDETYTLAKMLGKEKEVSHYPLIARRMRQAALRTMYDSRRGVMTSGPHRQVSVLAQTWAVKSGVLNARQGRKAITTALAMSDALMPGTPYGMHYLIDAMLLCGMKEEAKNRLTDYWGGMVKRGADTFWEAYDPSDDYLSPYDFFPVNSACHAWSCTPVWFIQQYPDIFR